MTPIRRGTKVIITDADGHDYFTEALSAEEQYSPRSLPIIWVNRPLSYGGVEPFPWPAEAVRRADTPEKQ